MGTVAFDYFVPEAAPWLPGCPNQVIRNALRNSCIEFCRRSLAWVVDPAAVLTQADEPAYDIALPTAKTELVMFRRVWVGGTEVFPLDANNAADIATPIADLGSGTVTRYGINGDNQLVLTLAPADDDIEIVVKAAICPTRDGDVMDSVLASIYYEQLAAGAIARLSAEENKPWSNPSAADRRKAQFESGVLAAMNREAKGRTNKSSTVKPVSFA